MSTTSPSRTSSPTGPRPNLSVALRVSRYDQASGMLVSLLMLLGFCVGVMFFVWLSSQVWRVPQPPKAVPWDEPEPGGGGSGAASDNLEEPEPDEIIEEVDPPIEMTLEAVVDVVSLQAADLEKIKPMAKGTGQGRGTGDGRGVGPGGDGTADIVPRWERWDIRYSTSSTEMYARQLDSFGIELGAVGGGQPTIDYAAVFGEGSPKRRSGPASEEKRLYFTWKQGNLLEADTSLLTLAGVATKGRIVMQLYDKEVENTLAGLEREKAGARDVRNIRRTVFGVRPQGAKFEYYVIEQTYRTFQQ